MTYQSEWVIKPYKAPGDKAAADSLVQVVYSLT
jgi:hypothetical protein